MLPPSPIQTGSFDSGGSPVIKITVFGVLPSLKQEFEAVIDTGFTGFLLMPLMSALPLALPLINMSPHVLADGTSSQKLQAVGTVQLGGRDTPGAIVLEPNPCSVLLGMEYFRASKRALIVSSGSVFLVDEDAIAQFGKTPPPETSPENP